MHGKPLRGATKPHSAMFPVPMVSYLQDVEWKRLLTDNATVSVRVVGFTAGGLQVEYGSHAGFIPVRELGPVSVGPHVGLPNRIAHAQG